MFLDFIIVAARRDVNAEGGLGTGAERPPKPGKTRWICGICRFSPPKLVALWRIDTAGGKAYIIDGWF